jgi:prophage tail gpP-like protein
MKKNVNKSRLIIAAAMLVSSVAFTPSANAGTTNGTNPVELKLVAHQSESPVFELVINNAETAEYKIVIRDENNTVLYADKLKGKNLNRRFQLKNEDAISNGETITFEVTNLETGKSVLYKVNTVTSIKKETTITVAR